MPTIAPARDRLISFLELSAERLGEVAIIGALAVAKAWSKYADRRETKRAGRRASDRERAAYTKSIARLEQLIAELTTLIARLTARVRALERAAGRKED
jgi:hypothetical protein